jgi:hypothetical protein
VTARNLQSERHTVVVVSTRYDQAQLAREISGQMDGTKYLFDIFTVEGIREMRRLPLLDFCVVLIDIDPQEIYSESMIDLYADMNAAIIENNTTDILFVAISRSLDFDCQQALYFTAGIDLVLEYRTIDTILIATLGLARRLRALRYQRRATFVYEDKPAEMIGQWKLLSGSRSVVHPNGSYCNLTQAEWDYLYYLYKRDVKKVDVAKDAELIFRQKSNLKALVYRIKKKLGSDFPLHSAAPGAYRLEVDGLGR